MRHASSSRWGGGGGGGSLGLLVVSTLAAPPPRRVLTGLPSCQPRQSTPPHRKTKNPDSGSNQAQKAIQNHFSGACFDTNLKMSRKLRNAFWNTGLKMTQTDLQASLQDFFTHNVLPFVSGLRWVAPADCGFCFCFRTERSLHSLRVLQGELPTLSITVIPAHCEAHWQRDVPGSLFKKQAGVLLDRLPVAGVAVWRSSAGYHTTPPLGSALRMLALLQGA